MSFFAIDGIRVAGISAAVPAHTVHNRDLTILTEREKEDLLHKVGIGSRRVAPTDICASDLCVAAARTLLTSAGIDATAVAALVFVTQTPDQPVPGNSMKVQQRLGIRPDALLLDLHQGCAGYVYGLSVLSGMMAAAGLGCGLLLVGDTITRLLSPADRTTLPIFGDAGSATLLVREPGAPPIAFSIGADGQGSQAIAVEAGGSREPFSAASLVPREFATGISRAPMHLAMEGIDVLNYSLRNVVPNIQGLLRDRQLTTEEIAHFVLHQANRILNDSILRKLGVPAAKAPETLSVFGNTSCATIPLTLVYRLGPALRAGAGKILLCGFGAGFSWGSALLDAGPLVCPPLLEIPTRDEGN